MSYIPKNHNKKIVFEVPTITQQAMMSRGKITKCGPDGCTVGEKCVLTEANKM